MDLLDSRQRTLALLQSDLGYMYTKLPLITDIQETTPIDCVIYYCI